MAEWQAPLGLPRTWGVLMEHRLTLWSLHGEGANSRHPRGRTLGDGLGHQQKEEMPVYSSAQAEVFKLLDNGEESWTPSEGTESTQGNNGALESSEARVYLPYGMEVPNISTISMAVPVCICRISALSKIPSCILQWISKIHSFNIHANPFLVFFFCSVVT